MSKLLVLKRYDKDTSVEIQPSPALMKAQSLAEDALMATNLRDDSYF